MPKTLAELMESPHVGRPETLHDMCLAGKLNAAIDAIGAELDDLLHAEADKLQQTDPDAPTPPGRLARPAGRLEQNPRIAELNAKREEIRTQMRDHTVTLRIRAMEEGAWRAWRQANPPRPDDKADARANFNIDALLDLIASDPRRFVVDINGEAYTDDQWAFLWGAAAEGDKWALAATVRLIHQGSVEVPKSLSSWLTTPQQPSSSA